MTAKIFEVFRSIQGEGSYLGVAQVFVRFFECNIHCAWCDTPASIGDSSRHYQDVALPELISQVKSLYDGCHSVSITGGEPLLQAEFLQEFLPALRGLGMKVYLETSGILPEELNKLIDAVDIVSMDIKLPSSTKEKEFWVEHKAFLEIAKRKETFIKAVITQDTTTDDVMKACRLIQETAPQTLFILQPNYFDMAKAQGCVARCVELQKQCLTILPDVRVIPQVHKFMKLR